MLKANKNGGPTLTDLHAVAFVPPSPHSAAIQHLLRALKGVFPHLAWTRPKVSHAYSLYGRDSMNCSFFTFPLHFTLKVLTNLDELLEKSLQF